MLVNQGQCRTLKQILPLADRHKLHMYYRYYGVPYLAKISVYANYDSDWIKIQLCWPHDEWQPDAIDKDWWLLPAVHEYTKETHQTKYAIVFGDKRLDIKLYSREPTAIPHLMLTFKPRYPSNDIEPKEVFFN
jgi:hypothetical protein